MIETNKIKRLKRKIANAELRVLKMPITKQRFIEKRCQRIDELKSELHEEVNKPYSKEF